MIKKEINKEQNYALFFFRENVDFFSPSNWFKKTQLVQFHFILRRQNYDLLVTQKCEFMSASSSVKLKKMIN